MKIFIAYTKHGCVTGKALRQALGAKRKRTNKKMKCDLLIRWGSSEDLSQSQAKTELNSREAVSNASNKKRMLELLKQAEITIPRFSCNVSEISELADESGNVYIRDKQGVVRYGNDFNIYSDSYFTEPVKNKQREYRVQVFRDKIMGVYEKIPLTEEVPKLYKSYTCKFSKCDITLEGARVHKEAQEMCINSVKALGLDFGGVDLIRDSEGNFTVCEVNSAMGLNSLNIEKWAEEFRNVIHNARAV